MTLLKVNHCNFLTFSGLMNFNTRQLVIQQGFEPWTHSLEGCCSNPTELLNRYSNRLQN